MIFQEWPYRGVYRICCWKKCGDFRLHVTCKHTHTLPPLRYSGQTKPKNLLGVLTKPKTQPSVAPNRAQFSRHVGAALGCVGRYRSQEGSKNMPTPR
jgi:hypothetical protein